MRFPGRRIALILFVMLRAKAMATPVQLMKDGDAYQLRREGQPYFIRGAGGEEKLWGTLADCGGNSVRLWGDERLGEQLDLARRDGLTVTAGIWLPQTRRGFDYTDSRAVAGLREHVRRTVLRYKDHPALLIWALGNEVEDPQGGNLAVWTVINDLAGLVKEIDPIHPVMTVVAEIGGEKVANFQRLCPSIDILGINSYGGVQSLGERYRKLGGTKPYILTEFGPAGIWESGKDGIGAYAEPSSTQKAETYRLAYKHAVLDQPDLCLGSYAFFWGQKQEVTSTWFSLFLADGSRLAAVDAITELWTGRVPAKRCPEIKLALEGAPLVKPGAIVEGKLEILPPANDPLTVTWQLVRDAENYASAGDAETNPVVVPSAVIHGDQQGAKIRLPADGGLYRLFAVVRDNRGGAAAANFPIRVDAPKPAPKRQHPDLPVVIYAEDGGPSKYTPSGWMGDVKAIRLDPSCPTSPHAGKTCLRCEFAATAGWSGVAWQHPADDWGGQDGGYDLTGATRLSFWARGEQGGETVDFKFGVISREKPYFDTAHGELPNVVLTSEWRRYEIPAGKQDLSHIMTGFVWSLASPGRSVVFYLDDIQWE